GYIREHGMEQLVRDARITQLYEGTNGIQALDLVGRKMPKQGGRLLRQFFHPVANSIEKHQTNEELAPFVPPLAKAFGRLQQATARIAQKGLANPDEAGAAATDYLRMFGLTALAYLWAQMAEISIKKLKEDPGGEEQFYKAKIATAKFYFSRILPQGGALFAQIMSGAETLMSFDEEAF
ncbi:MAG: acyl-CoA dehydrogenase, partial [Alphaproteobacteria bacterium]